jgi:hypothetical protein
MIVWDVAPGGVAGNSRVLSLACEAIPACKREFPVAPHRVAPLQAPQGRPAQPATYK